MLVCDEKRHYYDAMREKDRSVLIVKDGHLVGIVTFFVGDDDKKYLTEHVPWSVVDDDPEGETLYIDQWLTYKGRSTSAYVHREFSNLLQSLKQRFKNLKRVKWVRVSASFRKHQKLEGVKRYVHCKNIK